MTSLMHTLGIDQMSDGDRAQLVDEILESLNGTEPPPLSEELRRELDRRIAYFDAHPEEVQPWAEVKARVLARLNQWACQSL